MNYVGRVILGKKKTISDNKKVILTSLNTSSGNMNESFYREKTNFLTLYF